MGWMNDTLAYFSTDPIHRKYHQNKLTFSMLYAFTENFVLPFSHDEVVHGKNSLLHKMPGDMWQQFANLRLLYAYQYGHPGKKLLFMGQEFGQRSEFSEARSLDWHLLQYDSHRGIQRLIADLNKLYAAEPALQRRRQQRLLLHAPRQKSARLARSRAERNSGRSPGLSHRRPSARLLPGSLEYRLRHVWWLERRQHGRRPVRANAPNGPPPQHRPNLATPSRHLPQVATFLAFLPKTTVERMKCV
jgi:hypothetical protein